MSRPADRFFRLLEGLRLGQLHENHRAGHASGQLDAEIPAVGRIACQGCQCFELSFQGKQRLNSSSHESTVRQQKWLFRRGRVHSGHWLRIILVFPKAVTNRMNREWSDALLARRADERKGGAS